MCQRRLWVLLMRRSRLRQQRPLHLSQTNSAFGQRLSYVQPMLLYYYNKFMRSFLCEEFARFIAGPLSVRGLHYAFGNI